MFKIDGFRWWLTTWHRATSNCPTSTATSTATPSPFPCRTLQIRRESDPLLRDDIGHKPGKWLAIKKNENKILNGEISWLLLTKSRNLTPPPPPEGFHYLLTRRRNALNFGKIRRWFRFDADGQFDSIAPKARSNPIARPRRNHRRIFPAKFVFCFEMGDFLISKLPITLQLGNQDCFVGIDGSGGGFEQPDFILGGDCFLLQYYGIYDSDNAKLCETQLEFDTYRPC